MGFTEILTIIFVLCDFVVVVAGIFAGNHRRCLLHHRGYRKRNGCE